MLELQPGYLLHAKPYRNTSLLADFFTLKHGRVNGVVRGARGPSSKLRGIAQAFVPLEISWVGEGDLVTIRQIEPAHSMSRLSGTAILHGLYLNELLVRLLRVRDAHEDLYYVYQTMLATLSQGDVSEITLRLFEKRLLASLGYALQLTQEHDTGNEVKPEAWYQFFPDKGPQQITLDNTPPWWAFSGTSLLALATEVFTAPVAVRDAKRLLRHAIARLLNDKPLKSRELFIM